MPRINYFITAAVISLVAPGVALAQTGQPAPTQAGPATASAPAAGVKLGADGKVELAPGTEVFDTQGGKVGTLTKVDGSNVVLKTAKSEVLIPASSLARTEKSVLIAMTATQIDEAAAAASAKQTGGAASQDTDAGAGASAQSPGPAGAANPSN